MARKEKTVRQVYTLPDLALLTGILAVGVVFIMMGEGWNGAGCLVLLGLVLLLPFWRHGYRIAGQKGLFALKEILVARECRDEILAFLDGSADSLEHRPVVDGGALVDLYVRKKDGLALARYFEYADSVAGLEYELHALPPEKVRRLEEIGATGA